MVPLDHAFLARPNPATRSGRHRTLEGDRRLRQRSETNGSQGSVGLASLTVRLMPSSRSECSGVGSGSAILYCPYFPQAWMRTFPFPAALRHPRGCAGPKGNPAPANDQMGGNRLVSPLVPPPDQIPAIFFHQACDRRLLDVECGRKLGEQGEGNISPRSSNLAIFLAARTRFPEPMR